MFKPISQTLCGLQSRGKNLIGSDMPGSALPTAPGSRSVTEIRLADNSGAGLELLLGALHFMQSGSENWLTWVSPPKTYHAYFAQQQMAVNKLRIVHRDQQRSTFHLLYLALQAGNSSWVIGSAQGLTFRQTELLEQAAQHNACRLLLISTDSDLEHQAASDTIH